MKEKDKCILFLQQNGWRCDIDNPSEEYDSYYKEGYIGVDFDGNRMVFIGENGDFLHELINYYTLIGVLMEYRQIDCGYASIK